jgi:hypothetical protein
MSRLPPPFLIGNDHRNRGWEPVGGIGHRFSESTLSVICHAAAAAVASSVALLLAKAAGMGDGGFPPGMIYIMAAASPSCWRSKR